MLGLMLKITPSFSDYQFVIAGAPSLDIDFYSEFLKNYNVSLVRIDQVYNEFSSGGQDVTAIRDFMNQKTTTGGKFYFGVDFHSRRQALRNRDSRRSRNRLHS